MPRDRGITECAGTIGHLRSSRGGSMHPEVVSLDYPAMFAATSDTPGSAVRSHRAMWCPPGGDSQDPESSDGWRPTLDMVILRSSLREKGQPPGGPASSPAAGLECSGARCGLKRRSASRTCRKCGEPGGQRDTEVYQLACPVASVGGATASGIGQCRPERGHGTGSRSGAMVRTGWEPGRP